MKGRWTADSGLTLVEIVVVLIILGVVFTMIAPKVLSQGDKAKARVTTIQMQKIKSYVEQFQLQYNILPSSLDDLTRCTEKTGSNCIPMADVDELRDAWSNAFTLESNGNRYSIKSLGKDGRQGGSGVDADLIVEGP